MHYIFENESIDINEIDFNYWLNEDGEYIEIEEMTQDEIDEAVLTLKRKLKLLPEHVNEDIWEEYLYILKEEILHRKDQL